MGSVYNFKVFKATTRFKKPNRSVITKSIRRKYSRRRHRTNWVNMLYITRFWVNMFLKQKQFIRYYQSLGIVNAQLFSTSVFLVNKQLPNLNSSAGFSTFSCSKKLLNYFILGSNKWAYTSPIPKIAATGMLALGVKEASSLVDINPGLISYDNNLYTYDVENSLSMESLLILLNTNTLIQTQAHVLSYYRILIQLTLWNLYK